MSGSNRGRDHAAMEGLSWPTVVRLKNLEMIKTHLLTDGDEKYGQLLNVNAIIKAYRSVGLTLVPGCSLVGKPIQFSWKDFDKYNKQADDLVWVEGANGPGAMPMWAYNSPGYTKKYAVNHLYTQNYHEVEFSVKIPGANDNESTVLPFVYDTGCSICRLYEEDLQVIVDMAGQSAPFFCYIGVQSSQGHYTVVSTCKLAFNIHDQSWKNQGNWPRPWVEVQCSVDPGKAPTGWHLRLDEPWLRDLYYIATAPDNNHTL
ncbi:hypothetical protein N7512_008153 [Penicillium capsulatum]|nr:hypothetical protein N7512_008153 [Penicillium capsulatum]